MAGLPDTTEATILDSATLGLGQALYLRLIKWTGTTGGGDGKTVSDDGTFAANVAEVSGGGYAPLAVASGDWNAAVAGAPTTKTGPKSGGPAGGVFSFSASGANFGEIIGWALTTNTSAITSANLIYAGVLGDSSGATHQIVNDGQTIRWDTTHLLKAQIGDIGDTFG